MGWLPFGLHSSLLRKPEPCPPDEPALPRRTKSATYCHVWCQYNPENREPSLTRPDTISTSAFGDESFDPGLSATPTTVTVVEEATALSSLPALPSSTLRLSLLIWVLSKLDNVTS